MMKTKRLKYIFFVCSAFLLFLMLFLSRDAGISCDEIIHYQHSVSVYNYFATRGQDHTALETPDTYLKYYGQSCDNLATILIKWFNIDDIYAFRHLMSSLFGWFVILLTALFAVWLSGYRTGIIVLFLFAVSPTFLGHALNNLKDIPYALSYIAGIFFAVRFLFPDKNYSWPDILFLILSFGFSLSLRAGGLLLICYLFLFFFIIQLIKYFREDNYGLNENGKKLIIIVLASGSAYLLGILLWPFALQDPIKNVIESYRVMVHYPLTFRQLFEGNSEWSDMMPWYFIPKSMAITIPVIVLSGFILFFLFVKKIYRSGKALIYGMILFTIIFPLVFVIIEKSNVYSSWRQFLFLYPVIILIAASGLSYLADALTGRIYRWGLVVLFILLSIHPVRFIVLNHPYEYLYYNQLVGGLEGAYGNYETDYYFVSQTEASDWFIKYLQDKRIDSATVKATFSVDWSFREHPGIKTSYFRNEERSQYDWDYAIISNRYISSFQLKNKIWPPGNAIHIIYADGVPVGAVLERRTKADYYGFRALGKGRINDAIMYFEEALKIDDKDELIFYNFARALNTDGQYRKADSVLMKALEIRPDFEPVLMYLGNIARVRNDSETAIRYYEKLIRINRKYFEAYVELARLLVDTDLQKSRKLLRDCLTINPHFRPAIIALAETYKKTDPEIAEKYYRMADTIK